MAIIILGLLAATVLPRFVNLSDQAAEAQFKETMAAYKTGINLLNMNWIVQGKPASIEVDKIGIYMTAAGWPWYTATNKHVPLPYAQYNGRYSIQLWFAILTMAPPINGSTTVPTSGWYGSAMSGTRMTYSYFKGSKTWAFRYDRANGEIKQTLP